MEKFSRTLRGYDPTEVNAFLDKIIKQVEEILVDVKAKDERIAELEEKVQETDQLTKKNEELQAKLEHYERLESTLNQAILMAQKTSEKMKSSAVRESEIIIGDAKNNASRIVNEALLKAEKVERDADSLRRNIKVFKKRLKDVVESQMEIIDDIEKIEL